MNMKNISKEIFKEIFSNKDLINNQIIDLFEFIYQNNGEASATEVEISLGLKD